MELYITKQRTLQDPATRCNTQLHAATHCMTLQLHATVAGHPALLHAATRCNTLYDTATPCNSHSTPSAKTRRAKARASSHLFLIAQYIWYIIVSHIICPLLLYSLMFFFFFLIAQNIWYIIVSHIICPLIRYSLILFSLFCAFQHSDGSRLCWLTNQRRLKLKKVHHPSLTPLPSLVWYVFVCNSRSIVNEELKWKSMLSVCHLISYSHMLFSLFFYNSHSTVNEKWKWKSMLSIWEWTQWPTSICCGSLR